MEFDWAESVREIIGILLIYAWGAAMLDITLASYRADKRKRMITWILTGAGVAAVSLAGQWIYEVVNILTIDINGDDLATFGVLFLLGILNLVVTFTATIGILVAAKRCYTNADSTKTFTAILLGLGTLVLSGYICPLTEMLFTRVDEETGGMVPVHIALYIFIHVFWIVVIYALYRKYLLKHLKSILDTPDGNMDTFVKVPLISCVTFGISLALGDAFGLSSSSELFLNRGYWVLVMGSLVLVYVLMYWSIFRAITLSTQSMKTKAELDVASKIQASVLPRTFPAFPEREEFDIYAMMEPAKEVGGDFYDFFLLDDGHLAVVIADVSGKGVPAALFMMSARTMIKNQCAVVMDAGKVLSIVNNQLAENNEEGMFVTTFLAILNLKTGELQCGNAGHNPPYIVRADGTVEPLKMRAGFVLAGMEGIRYRNHTVQLNKKDKLLLYTDGVTEATNTALELYGETRLEEVLKGTEQIGPKPCIEKIHASLMEFAGGAEQADDITMVILEME